ncbi:flagellar hook-associated protein FlgL [Pseudomonas aeruginosa]|nr:flagellar hook-associated protein FlgL [Pseudomonas aeruginosa]
MRISTIQAFNNSVNGISRNYADLNRTFEQISTGKRILTPADDPVGSVRLLRLDQEQGLNEQYKTGMTEAKNSLSQEETIPPFGRQRPPAHPRDRRPGRRRRTGLQ